MFALRHKKTKALVRQEIDIDAYYHLGFESHQHGVWNVTKRDVAQAVIDGKPFDMEGLHSYPFIGSLINRSDLEVVELIAKEV